MENMMTRALGHEYEDVVAASFYEYFRKEGKEKDCQQVTGGVKDIAQGTDLLIWGVPVDLTYNFSGKDHMVTLDAEVETDVSTVKFGVRTGNSHKGYTEFDQPVLVIGVDEQDSFIRMFLERLGEAFEKMARKILDTAFDAYWNYIDEAEAAAV